MYKTYKFSAVSCLSGSWNVCREVSRLGMRARRRFTSSGQCKSLKSEAFFNTAIVSYTFNELPVYFDNLPKTSKCHFVLIKMSKDANFHVQV